MPQFTLIGLKYLGPGNPLNNGEPINTADKIAQVHDNEYHLAKIKEDIYNSDRNAIEDIKKDFLENPNLSSLIGYSGLSIKHNIEKSINRVIYPTNISGKNAKTKSKSGLY